MTIDQRITVSRMQSEGFTVSEKDDAVIIVRGNDYRLVMPDGSQKRARGAKK